MQKFLFTMFCFFIISNKTVAQDTTGNGVPAFDSAAVLNDLMQLLDSTDVSASYGLVSVGITNRLFSLHNNNLNAKQSTTSALVYSPSLGYFHKSGFSVSAGASLVNRSGKGLGVTQYSVTPAYDLTNNRNWTFGISYSRYIIKDKYSPYSSPIQNDFYTYASYKKHWLEPGIAFGYSTGNYSEINQFTVQLTGNTFTDTGTYRLKAFSMMGSLAHDFEWSGIFGKDDAAGFTPSLMISLGADSTETVSHSILQTPGGQNLIRFLKRRKRLPKLQGKNSLQAQSVALSLDLNYSVGRFSVLPQLYLDYYLPETDEKRFTQTFTLSLGYSF